MISFNLAVFVILNNYYKDYVLKFLFDLRLNSQNNLSIKLSLDKFYDNNHFALANVIIVSSVIPDKLVNNLKL